MIDDFFVALLIAAYLMLFFVLLYLAGRKMWELLTRRHPEPETHGDDGGRPAGVTPELRSAHKLYSKWKAGDEPAPENGSSERAGGVDPANIRSGR